MAETTTDTRVAPGDGVMADGSSADRSAEVAAISEQAEIYEPPQSVVEQAIVRDPDALRAKAAEDLEAFWAAEAETLKRLSIRL